MIYFVEHSRTQTWTWQIIWSSRLFFHVQILFKRFHLKIVGKIVRYSWIFSKTRKLTIEYLPNWKWNPSWDVSPYLTSHKWCGRPMFIIHPSCMALGGPYWTYLAYEYLARHYIDMLDHLYVKDNDMKLVTWDLFNQPGTWIWKIET